jgi:NAD(P)H dehydrogenase (quinone)
VRFLVVHAHPDPDSFTRAICDTAVGALRSSGHDVTLVDLYADGFTTAMSAQERVAYEGDAPILDPLVRRYADLVKSSEGLVFVYPTWWWGMPAILKGFLERVLVPGVSFSLDPSTNKVVPGLLHVRRLIGISTYGSSWFAIRLFNDGGRRLVLRCIRLLTPKFGCTADWLALYSLDRRSPAERAAFLTKVSSTMGRR